MTDDKVVVPGKGVEPQEPQYQEPSVEEQLASEQGWVPKEEWKGNPDEWRPAKEFNDRGELFTRIKTQSRELSEIKRAMTFLQDQQRNQYDLGYKQAIAGLKNSRTSALQEGDVVTAQQLTDRIEAVKEQHQTEMRQQTVVPPVAPSVEFKTWFDKNTWYTKDKVLSKFAESVGYEFKQENPDVTETEMLNHVSKTLRKEFPHKFGPKGPPSPDGEGYNPRGSDSPNTGYRSAENSMTEEQRGIMRTILKSTGMTKDQYFKQYNS